MRFDGHVDERARIGAAAVQLDRSGLGDVSVEELERAHISAVVARCRTMEEAAEILGIDVSTLWRKRKRYEGADE
jgi:NtrC-family two-component system response regulator AlgB